MAGATASFNVVAGGDGPFTYQWMLNGNAIAANSPTVIINGTSLGSEVVGLIVNDAAGESIGANATINVTTAPAAPQSQQNTGGSVGGGLGGGGGSSKPNVTAPVTTTTSTVPSTTTITNVTNQPQSTVSTTSIIQSDHNTGNGGVNSGNSAPPSSKTIIPAYEIEAIAIIAVAGIALAYYFYIRPRIKH